MTTQTHEFVTQVNTGTGSILLAADILGRCGIGTDVSSDYRALAAANQAHPWLPVPVLGRTP